MTRIKIDKDIEIYYKENQDEVESNFENHIENLYADGNSDVGRLSKSDDYFWEWLEERLDSNISNLIKNS